MNHLDFELLKRIFGNLGAVPGKHFGMAGLVIPECKYSNPIVIQLDDEPAINCSVWIGQLISDHNCKAAVVNLGTTDVPELVMIFVPGQDVAPLGFKLNLDPDDLQSSFMQKTSDEWSAISTLYKLNLTAAFELITQEGIGWEPISELGEFLFSLLVSIVEN